MGRCIISVLRGVYNQQSRWDSLNSLFREKCLPKHCLINTDFHSRAQVQMILTSSLCSERWRTKGGVRNWAADLIFASVSHCSVHFLQAWGRRFICPGCSVHVLFIEMHFCELFFSPIRSEWGLLGGFLGPALLYCMNLELNTHYCFTGFSVSSVHLKCWITWCKACSHDGVQTKNLTKNQHKQQMVKSFRFFFF